MSLLRGAGDPLGTPRSPKQLKTDAAARTIPLDTATLTALHAHPRPP